MADRKISEFVDGGPVQETDEIATNRSGVNTKVFVGSMAAEDADEYTKTDDLEADIVGYDNTSSGLTANDVQSAIDEIVSASGGGNVVADNNIADNAIVRGDGGAKKVQTSSASVDDSGNVGANTFNAGTLTDFLSASGGAVKVTLTAPTASANRTYTLPNASGAVVLATNTATLTNKTIDLTNNVLTGTKAQFDTACSDGNFLYVGDVTQYTDEMAQDAVGGILTDTATIDFTYNDGGNQISADVKANSSVQKIEVVKNSGSVVGTRKQLNFVEGTNVTLTVSDDNTNDQVDITIAAAAGGGFLNSGYRANDTQMGLCYSAPNDSTTITANRAYFQPFYCMKTTTFTGICIYITTAVSANIRLGIYTLNNGRPDTLVLDAGTVSTATTGKKEITISQSLTGGTWYALGYVSDGTPNVGSVTSTTARMNLPLIYAAIGDSVGGYTGNTLGLWGAFTYGTFPSTWVASLNSNTLGIPAVWMEV